MNKKQTIYKIYNQQECNKIYTYIRRLSEQECFFYFDLTMNYFKITDFLCFFVLSLISFDHSHGFVWVGVFFGFSK